MLELVFCDFNIVCARPASLFPGADLFCVSCCAFCCDYGITQQVIHQATDGHESSLLPAFSKALL